MCIITNLIICNDIDIINNPLFANSEYIYVIRGLQWGNISGIRSKYSNQPS